jgi:hypothetical protein
MRVVVKLKSYKPIGRQAGLHIEFESVVKLKGYKPESGLETTALQFES